MRMRTEVFVERIIKSRVIICDELNESLRITSIDFRERRLDKEDRKKMRLSDVDWIGLM